MSEPGTESDNLANAQTLGESYAALLGASPQQPRPQR